MGDIIWVIAIILVFVSLMIGSAYIHKVARNERNKIERRALDINSKTRAEWSNLNSQFLKLYKIDKSETFFIETRDVEFEKNWLNYDIDTYSIIVLDDSLHFVAKPIYLAIDDYRLLDDFYYNEMIKSKLNLISKSIKFSEIIYYSMEGGLSTNSIVTGTGGGFNFEGAVIGGVIARDTGAIIGSRSNIDVSTSLISVDNRLVEVYFLENNEQLNVKVGSPELYAKLVIKIPNKEISRYLNSVNNNKIASSYQTESLVSDNTLTIEKKFVQLKELYDKGIINENEYNKKRDALISSI